MGFLDSDPAGPPSILVAGYYSSEEGGGEVGAGKGFEFFFSFLFLFLLLFFLKKKFLFESEENIFCRFAIVSFCFLPSFVLHPSCHHI